MQHHLCNQGKPLQRRANRSTEYKAPFLLSKKNIDLTARLIRPSNPPVRKIGSLRHQPEYRPCSSFGIEFFPLGFSQLSNRHPLQNPPLCVTRTAGGRRHQWLLPKITRQIVTGFRFILFHSYRCPSTSGQALPAPHDAPESPTYPSHIPPHCPRGLPVTPQAKFKKWRFASPEPLADAATNAFFRRSRGRLLHIFGEGSFHKVHSMNNIDGSPASFRRPNSKSSVCVTPAQFREPNTVAHERVRCSAGFVSLFIILIGGHRRPSEGGQAFRSPTRRARAHPPTPTASHHTARRGRPVNPQATFKKWRFASSPTEESVSNPQCRIPQWHSKQRKNSEIGSVPQNAIDAASDYVAALLRPAHPAIPATETGIPGVCVTRTTGGHRRQWLLPKITWQIDTHEVHSMNNIDGLPASFRRPISKSSVCVTPAQFREPNTAASERVRCSNVSFRYFSFLSASIGVDRRPGQAFPSPTRRIRVRLPTRAASHHTASRGLPVTPQATFKKWRFASSPTEKSVNNPQCRIPQAHVELLKISKQRKNSAIGSVPQNAVAAASNYVKPKPPYRSRNSATKRISGCLRHQLRHPQKTRGMPYFFKNHPLAAGSVLKNFSIIAEIFALPLSDGCKPSSRTSSRKYANPSLRPFAPSVHI